MPFYAFKYNETDNKYKMYKLFNMQVEADMVVIVTKHFLEFCRSSVVRKKR